MKIANIYMHPVSFTITIIILKKKTKTQMDWLPLQQANFRQDNCELHIRAPFPSLWVFPFNSPVRGVCTDGRAYAVVITKFSGIAVESPQRNDTTLF